MPEQMKGLEDEADAAGPNGRAFLFAELAGVDAVDQIGAGRRAIEAAEHIEERRLARSRGTYDRNPVTTQDREIDSTQRVDGWVRAVSPAQPLHLHDRTPLERRDVRGDGDRLGNGLNRHGTCP